MPRRSATCCATMHHGGSIAMLGIPPGEVAIDWNQVIFKGLVIKGIYGREMFETWYKMAAMLQSGLDVSGVITHRFPIDDYEPRIRDHGRRPVRQGDPRLGGKGYRPPWLTPPGRSRGKPAAPRRRAPAAPARARARADRRQRLGGAVRRRR